MRITLITFCFAMIWTPALSASEYIWWEGENTKQTNFPKRSWFDPKPNEANKLSQGRWLTNEGKRKVGEDESFAIYQIKVDQAGEYQFWTRKFWKHGPFRWRFDQNKWQTCGRDVALADNVTLRTHLNANWVYLGKVKLTKGTHRFELRLLAKQGEAKTACFDCFVLSPGVFIPNGKNKPGTRLGVAEAGRFAFEPAIDTFTDDALLDLRYLNEKQAGQFGRIAKKKDSFITGDGKPIRFWAVNVSSSNAAQDHASVDYLARKLAKLGVNMVRYHSPIYDKNNPKKLDAKKLDDLYYLIHALQKQGIYTHISFYFPLWCNGTKMPGLQGYDTIANKNTFAILYFDPTMQMLYQGWLDQLMQSRNPYTRKTIAEDSAVAIVELVNEDSLFFWTFNKKSIPPYYWRMLEKQFGKWLTKRYGSIANAIKIWDGSRAKGDDPEKGYAAIFEAWNMTSGALKNASPARRKRIGDQVQFLTKLQRHFYEKTARYLKTKLHYAGLTSASNWKTADPAMLGALEQYTYTACDVIDRHGYFGGNHKGDGASYSVRVGHEFTNIAGVTVPQKLPIQYHQVAGYPQITTELNWTNPNRYRADATFLTAAYSALQGCDGVYFFAVGSNYLVDQSMGKFPVSCPVIAGSFPANALIYRKGYVTESKPIIDEAVQLKDLYALKGSAAFSSAALDALRQKDLPKNRTIAGPVKGIFPLSFYAGKVQRRISNANQPSIQQQIDRLIEPGRKIIRSSTNQLTWNYGVGLVKMNTPYAQGVTGYLFQEGPIKLNDITITSDNDYAAVLVVSLDGKPITQSKRLLVQVTTDERPYGFRAKNNKITALGSYPFGLAKIECTIQLPTSWKNATITPLDENGYARLLNTSINLKKTPDPIFTLTNNAIYHIIQR